MRQDSASSARITRHEYQVLFFGPTRVHLEEVFDFCWFAVFVNSKQSYIEAIARILEIVGIATKESCSGFRCPHKSHVGVFLVAIEMVAAATIERNHIASQAGSIERCLFDGRHLGLSSFAGFLRRHTLFDCRVNREGYIFNGNELVEFEVRCFDFVRQRSRQKAIFVVVPFSGRKFVEGIGRNVMVGQHETLRRNKRGRSPRVKADTRKHQVI